MPSQLSLTRLILAVGDPAYRRSLTVAAQVGLHTAELRIDLPRGGSYPPHSTHRGEL